MQMGDGWMNEWAHNGIYDDDYICTIKMMMMMIILKPSTLIEMSVYCFLIKYKYQKLFAVL
jgi:hypothetical protein